MPFREKLRDSFGRKQGRRASLPDSSSYPYRQLPSNNIRVLKLAPGEPGAPLRGCLLTVNLLDYDDITALSSSKEVTHYDAISYVWGDPRKTALIDCDGHTVNITLNLRDALEHLRDPTEAISLWADALCIDQSNYNERAEQVKLMGLIYFKARSVHVWLGHDNFQDTIHSAAIAVSLMREKGPLRKQSTTESPADSLLEKPRACSDREEDKWTAVRYLLEVPWFRRVWAVQELGVSRDATFHCGSVTFKRRELYDFVSYLGSRGPLLAYQHRFDLRVPRLANQFTASVWSSNRIELGSHPEYAETFLEILEQARGLGCLDKRDNVYALLNHPSSYKQSLLDGAHYMWYPSVFYDEKPSIVQPDYNPSNTFLDVYLNVAVRYIETIKLGMDVLSYVAHDKETINEDFPSWVPRWDYGVTPVCLAGREWHNASGNLHAAPFTLIRKNKNHPVSKLELKALFLGQITFAHELTREPLYSAVEPLVAWSGDEIIGQRQYLRGDSKDPFDLAATLTAGLRTGDDMQIHPVAEEPEQHLARFQSFMLRGKKGVSSSSTSNKTPRTPQSDTNGITAISSSDSTSDKDAEADLFEADLWELGHRRTFFNTADGRSGLGPVVLRKGDEVWLPMGAQMPFVFRAIKSNKYKLVGQAYLHGVMGGEAVEGVGEDDFKVVTLY